MRNSLIILGILDDSDVEWFSKISRTIDLPTDEILIEEGIKIESLWVILEGSLSVTTITDLEKRFATIYPGEIVGEVSFLDSRPPAVTLVAAEPTRLLEVKRSDLKAKLNNDTHFASRFYRALGVCLAQRLIHLTHTTLTVSTLGVVDQDEPADAKVDTGSELDPEVLEAMSLASHRFEYLLERSTKN
ncbi:MAG: cyclic nucleotide-binding domain-containing protein [Planctomycetota bacterium]|nr:cyclic nucleotide-binding domain-containing protein [Planctomycetota bacterium]